MSDDPTNPSGPDRRGGPNRHRVSSESRAGDPKHAASRAERRLRPRRAADRASDTADGGDAERVNPTEAAAPGHDSAPHRTPFPTTKADVAAWIHQELALDDEDKERLIDGISALLFRYERLWERSKSDAIAALAANFTNQINRLKQEVVHRETTVTNVSNYFERIVHDLTIRASHDPKTHLMNFARFLEELDTYLAIEQRGRWCGVGLVDINSFKWYNDTLGHATGDLIIERVARLLQEHVRAADLVAHDSRELHARFGGDEFCFLIPDLDDISVASAIANRFRDAVSRFDWSTEDPRLAQRPVTVDVGVACLQLGSLSDRRRMGPQLARELLAYADRLMYQAKGDHAPHAYPLALRVENMTLVPVDSAEQV